ncbi:shikimate kinase [Ekhidna lutea]|uniref:Shikimate kinase n=1 Tax=Ekhidna lutea TaxID=447679 RepID=A0A239ITD8_EKHLU|nr:shikimate kinase [Ekhidna lutea]SNS97046.1 shikimate kinase [Ekhidna lutea]
MSQKIFLIGLPGAGKTTLGLDLAVDLGVQFVDLDQDIEKAEKCSIREIFELKGEAHFRQLEKYHLEKVINEIDSFVMATGGGTPCFFDNMEVMQKAGTICYINTPIEEIQMRIEKDTTRPLMKTNTLENLLDQRKEWYRRADHTIQKYKELIAVFKS